MATPPDEIDPRVLVACGDWACAHCEPEGLCAVATQIVAAVDDDERRVLAEVRRLTPVDMFEASRLWIEATRRLRRRFYGHAPDSSAATLATSSR